MRYVLNEFKLVYRSNVELDKMAPGLDGIVFSLTTSLIFNVFLYFRHNQLSETVTIEPMFLFRKYHNCKLIIFWFCYWCVAPERRPRDNCGTVALYGPFHLLFLGDHRAMVFTLSKTFETGCENDQTYSIVLWVFVLLSIFWYSD